MSRDMSDSEETIDVNFGDKPEKVLGWIGDCLEGDGDKIIVARGWCKRCGICISVCPVKALAKDPEGYPKVYNDKCINCGTCEIMCPDFAITVKCLKEKPKKGGPQK